MRAALLVVFAAFSASTPSFASAPSITRFAFACTFDGEPIMLVVFRVEDRTATGTMQVLGESPAELDISESGSVTAKVDKRTLTVRFSLTEDAELTVADEFALDRKIAGKCTGLIDND